MTTHIAIFCFQADQKRQKSRANFFQDIEPQSPMEECHSMCRTLLISVVQPTQSTWFFCDIFRCRVFTFAFTIITFKKTTVS